MIQLAQITDGLQPGPFFDLIHNTAYSVQIPPDLPLMAYKSGFGTAINGKFVLDLPGGHSEPSCYSDLVVSDSGERKSTAFSVAKNPLKVRVGLDKKRYEKRLRRAKTYRRHIKAKIAAFHREAASLDDAVAEGLILTQVEKLEERLPDLPIEPRLLFSDATPAALKRTMIRHDGRISHIEPEPVLIDTLCKGSSDLTLFCNAYDGEDTYIDRRNEPPLHLRSPAMSICIASQAEPAMKFVQNERVRCSGLLGRFWLVLIPSVAGTRATYTPPIPQEALDWYAHKITMLLDIPLQHDEAGNPVPYRLKLSGEAAALYQELRNWAEPALLPHGPLSFSKSWGSKYPGKVARLSMLIHCIDCDDPINTPVSGDSMRQAIAMGQAFIAHAQALYHQARFADQIEVANEIVYWVGSHGVQGFTAQDVRKGISCNSSKKIQKGIDYLVTSGAAYQDMTEYANEHSSKRRGRKKGPVYRLYLPGVQSGGHRLPIGQ